MPQATYPLFQDSLARIRRLVQDAPDSSDDEPSATDSQIRTEFVRVLQKLLNQAPAAFYPRLRDEVQADINAFSISPIDAPDLTIPVSVQWLSQIEDAVVEGVETADKPGARNETIRKILMALGRSPV